MTQAGSHHESLCIDAMHPALAGHFAGNPVVPGVLLLDRVLDAAQRHFELRADALRLPQIKFLQPLLPEQSAEIVLEAMTMDAANPTHARVRFLIERDGVLLASGELIASVADLKTTHSA